METMRVPLLTGVLVLLLSLPTSAAAQRVRIVEPPRAVAHEWGTHFESIAQSGGGRAAAFMAGGAVLGGVAGYAIVRGASDEEYAYPVLMPATVVAGAALGALAGWALHRLTD